MGDQVNGVSTGMVTRELKRERHFSPQLYLTWYCLIRASCQVIWALAVAGKVYRVKKIDA